MDPQNLAAKASRKPFRPHLGQAAAGSQEQAMMTVQVAERLHAETPTLHAESDGLRQKIEKLVAQNFRLKEELAMARREGEDAQNAMQKMVSDLMKTQRELHEKNKLVATLEQQVSGVRMELQDQAHAQDDQHSKMQDQIDKLHMKLRENASELCELRGDKSKTVTQTEQSWQEKASEQESLFKAKLASEKGKAQAEIQNYKALFQAQLSEEQEKAQAEIQKYKTQSQDAVSRLEELRTQSLTSAIPEAKVVTPESQVHSQEIQQLQATHQTELCEARRLIEFYKHNSEWLSSQTGKLKAENNELFEVSLQNTKTMEDQLAIIGALTSELDEKSQITQLKEPSEENRNRRRWERREQQGL